MNLPSWLRRWILSKKPWAIPDRQVTKNPLREFIYLDEVSLQSLLSSKNGEMTSTTSTQETQSVEAEFRTSASVAATGIGKAEAGSRFQTQNSSTLQTAKKATVQSWFRELDKVPNLRLLETVQQVRAFSDTRDLASCSNRSVCVREDRFSRGSVVEFRVRLAADPIFHLVTIVSEMKAMAEDYPTMMARNGGLDQFGEIEGISRVLQRLLAGLIPVRAEVIDYVVVEFEDQEYLVHVDAIKGLDIEHRPLEIGCVTELDAYWKDIRRVLFSDAEFTMLGRVAKGGLQAGWTPVKLQDLLGQLAPDLALQIDDAARIMFDVKRRGVPRSEAKPHFLALLERYSEAHLAEFETNLEQDQEEAINRKIAELATHGPSVSDQTAALKELAKFLAEVTGNEIEPQRALELRETARESSGLPYFDPPASTAPAAPTGDEPLPKNERFLDVEVVAMYW